MEQSISQTQPSDSTTDIRELRILMGDVTRENEALKSRLRQIQRSTTHLLLSSSREHTVHDDLRRENQRLTTQVKEFEQLTRQLQSSSEDNVLQRVLRDVTHENEALKRQLREMQHRATQIRTPNLVEGLQREIGELKAEVRRLQIEVQTASSSHVHEDPSIPPPAYED